MLNEAKRGAQEALFTAIREQAETNMHAALRASEKAHLLRELAEAYRLTAGGSMPMMSEQNAKPSDNGSSNGAPAENGARKAKPAP